jgi:hypothetical protein
VVWRLPFPPYIPEIIGSSDGLLGTGKPETVKPLLNCICNWYGVIFQIAWLLRSLGIAVCILWSKDLKISF